MIITRTPLRISLFGGGSDFKEYYKHKDGEVVSLAIDKYIYVQVNKKFDGRLHLRYSKTELVDTPDELKHDIVRECLKVMGIKGGIEVVISSDVPSVGTGLGSSSALTVGLLKALAGYVVGGKDYNNLIIAGAACHVEIDLVGSPIGKQDSYVCALGGINHLIFHDDGIVECVPLYDLYKERIDEILSSLVLFYISNGRESSEIHMEHRAKLNKSTAHMDVNVELVSKFLSMLDDSYYNAKKMGEMLTQGWMIKKENSLVSNSVVECAFSVADSNGSLGGKICGAGGGGVMLLVKREDRIIKIMERSGYKKIDFKLSEVGSQVIFKG